jgi:hypothetical protein
MENEFEDKSILTRKETSINIPMHTKCHINKTHPFQ